MRTTQKIRRTPRSAASVAAASALLAASAAVAPAAQAQTVRQVAFSFPVQDTITDLCPFPIDVSGTVAGHVQDFRDDAGNFVRVQLHFSNSFTLTALGTTLTERDHFTEFDLDFASTGGGAPGKVVTVGNVANIRVPQGPPVVVEAGRLTENVVTGEVSLNGHWSVTTGDAARLCGAF